jgi:hypothetical protein
VVYLVWELGDDERQAIALGGQVKLGIYYNEPIPPVSLNVVLEEKVIDSDPGHRIYITKEAINHIQKHGFPEPQDDRPPKPPIPPRDREVG